MTLPSVGEPAPDFTLRDQHGRDVRLRELRGGPVVLLFYPFAFSRVCSGELRSIRDDHPALVRADVRLLGISCDPMFALRAFADSERLTLPLLSDFWPHGAVARQYGVLDEDRGCARRSTFVLDGEGTLRWSVHNPMPDARDLGELERVLESLTGPAG
ncbi:MAG: peroxiredoxin [Actinomycetes bacterium]